MSLLLSLGLAKHIIDTVGHSIVQAACLCILIICSCDFDGSSDFVSTLCRILKNFLTNLLWTNLFDFVCFLPDDV